MKVIMKILHSFKYFSRFAEIGVLKGDLSKKILTTYPYVKEYYGIDPYEPYDDIGSNPTIHKRFNTKKDWDDLYKKTYTELEKFPQYHLMRTTSEDASKLFSNKYFDLVLIDGNHLYDYVKLDIKCWIPKIKKGGMIGGHDYGIDFLPGVKRAVDELIKTPMLFPKSMWFHTI